MTRPEKDVALNTAVGAPLPSGVFLRVAWGYARMREAQEALGSIWKLEIGKAKIDIGK
jgi:hypothetical protein